MTAADDTAQAAQPKRARHMLGSALLVVGGCGLAYASYDLVHPNHFVGDMYGLEVLVRLAILVLPGVLFLLAGSLTLSRIVRKARLGAAWLVLLASASSLLTAIAVHTALSRWRSAARNNYPTLSIEELVRIARTERDQHAVDALGQKDAKAIPELRAILLDRASPLNLRWCAAHSLRRIGGSAAKQALSEGRAVADDPMLREAIEYGLKELAPTATVQQAPESP